MRLGFFTDYSPAIAEFAHRTGFTSVQLSAWPSSYLNADKVTNEALKALKSDLKAKNIEISALGYYPNVLSEDAAAAEEARRYLKKVIDLAERMDVGVVATFAGRRKSLPVVESFGPFKEVFSWLVECAEKKSVRIAIENCPMHDFMTGSGDNIAYSPEIWDEMFRLVPSDHLGLEFDPSHCVWLQIDYIEAIRNYAKKLFHIHAKDMEIRRDILNRVSILGSATTFQGHVMAHGWPRARAPGWGEVDWPKFITALIDAGYRGNLDIEHEDDVFANTAVFSEHRSEADVVGNYGRDEYGLTRGFRTLSQLLA
jgi:sugar phosphate isomerase/epimerase